MKISWDWIAPMCFVKESGPEPLCLSGYSYVFWRSGCGTVPGTRPHGI